MMPGEKLNWMLVAAGVVLGAGVTLAAIVWAGRILFRRMGLRDRGEWDKPLPEPFPKEMVVAVYKRRRRYHRHHRDHYRKLKGSGCHPRQRQLGKET